MKVDYLIIGQGICGTLLSYALIKAGKKVLVIDENKPFTSTKVASGLINPVTGKRIVASWMIDELLPVAMEMYQTIGSDLGIKLIENCDIQEFHRSGEERDMFQKRIAEGCTYLKNGEKDKWVEYFNYHFGVDEIKPCTLVDLQALLSKWRQKLQQKNVLVEAVFDDTALIATPDGVKYDDIEAQCVIFCTGTASYENKWFSKLPYSINKGEVLIASIPGLPRNHIYKQGIKIIPWKNDLFWIGASYEWKYDNTEINPGFRQKVEEQLNYWLKLPCQIVDHWVAERPATVDYKPFVGFHPLMPSVGIFNGMGSKGCSQAPYFAQQLTRHLLNDEPIHPEADVRRFARILSR